MLNDLVLNNKSLELIKTWNLSYNNETDNIYINGIEADSYDKRVICARLKERCKLDIDEQELKKLISEIQDNNLIETVNEKQDNILSDISQIIEEDDTIPNSDWEQYKLWKENEAIWCLDKDGEKTKLNDCFENIVGFLENYPKTKGKIKFNNIRNIVEYEGRQVVDGDYHTFMNYINKYFMATFSKLKMIKDAVDNVANKNKYNPWTEYFDNLTYEDDGIDYIDYTIKEVLCCEEQDKYYDLYYETLKIMFLANMSRIYNKELKGEPTKYDTVVALCGKNGGSGKTTFFERLYDIDNNGNSYCYVVAGDAFQPKDRDFIERSHQCVCLFLDEISMRRAIVTSVKGYITQRDDRFRKAYGFNSESHMRGFIITASSNNDDILKDYTSDNERRWSIIKISENTKNYENVNKAFDNGYRDKLWAFIKNIYDTEEFKLYMTDDRLIGLEEDIQRGYKASNNADYQSIVDDLLEREYGFYEVDGKLIINSDFIVRQYKYGDSKDWCIKHNNEVEIKKQKFDEGKYIMQPEDVIITKFGKINRIEKKQLYEILDKTGFEWTKQSLNAEIRYSKRWNGHTKGHNMCRINGTLFNAYWRVNEEDIKELNTSVKNNTDKSPEAKIDGGLPF